MLNTVTIKLNVQMRAIQGKKLTPYISTDDLFSTFKGTPPYTESFSKAAQQGKKGPEGSNKARHLFEEPVSHLHQNFFCEIINLEESLWIYSCLKGVLSQDLKKEVLTGSKTEHR